MCHGTSFRTEFLQVSVAILRLLISSSIIYWLLLEIRQRKAYGSYVSTSEVVLIARKLSYSLGNAPKLVIPLKFKNVKILSFTIEKFKHRLKTEKSMTSYWQPCFYHAPTLQDSEEANPRHHSVSSLCISVCICKDKAIAKYVVVPLLHSNKFLVPTT